ncbi:MULTISPECIES: phosphatase PAP2 family protein [unclassified Thomasclavelia]|uniref:phosphatase PAP2 family protein n=1 Tax=unclassified Thomasclavelia TaxID=3025756 RepID=UPI000B3A07E7|nr:MULTISPECIES: phosphatase PAP2 family protein [unclassified Thomasclavelia]OUP78382.1 phosphatase PAP2 family protein [Erysipelatoclostridium sp. An173]OUQ08672.1 phosphatase PAP2 family protein [Erysipelatoclostridium sp. An15]
MVSKLKKNYRRYLFLIPLVLFIADYLLIVNGWMKIIDQFVFESLRFFASDQLKEIFKIITNLGSFWGILIVIFLVFLVNRKVSYICLGASIIQTSLNRVIKAIVRRPRPNVDVFIRESNFSFPSGHAMAITCLYGLLIYYLYKSEIRYRKLLIVICVLIIVLVSLSRVYLGVHYFSDIIGGILLSSSLVLYISDIPSCQA